MTTTDNITPIKGATAGCPSEFALERLRFGEVAASPEETRLLAHVGQCKTCRRVLAELAESPPPPPLDTEQIWLRIAASDRTGLGYAGRWLRERLAGWRRGLIGGALLGAAAAGVLLLVARPPASDITIKGGGPWQLDVIARRADGSLQRLMPGARLVAGDRLRFEVATSWARGNVVLVLLDASGVVSPLVPPSGPAAIVKGGQRILLDGAIELDSSVGPERIVLAACTQPVTVDDVVGAAKRTVAAAAGDPVRVSDLGTGCHEETFWITKERK
jgi:hypothetical protein